MFQKEYNPSTKKNTTVQYCDGCRAEIESWCRRPYHGTKTAPVNDISDLDWCVTCYGKWYAVAEEYYDHRTTLVLV